MTPYYDEEIRAAVALLEEAPEILEKLEGMRRRRFEAMNDVAQLLSEAHEERMRVIRERRAHQADAVRAQNEIMRGSEINHRRGETQIRHHIQFDVFTTEHWTTEAAA